jgi:arginine decarboxylase
MGSLRIPVVGATGEGPTSLAAFDAALHAAGVSNFNLVRLSSVIPPDSVVGPDLDERPLGEWGDRLYAVWAWQSAELLGEEAWAGVAWVQDPSDGRGLFVEHEGTSEAQVRRELQASLDSLCRVRGLEGLRQRSVVQGRRCEGRPVGALVIAPYQVADWR